MISLLKSILDTITTLITFLFNMITSLIALITQIPKFVTLIINSINVLPPFILPFATAFITISVVQYILNRKAE